MICQSAALIFFLGRNRDNQKNNIVVVGQDSGEILQSKMGCTSWLGMCKNTTSNKSEQNGIRKKTPWATCVVMSYES